MASDLRGEVQSTSTLQNRLRDAGTRFRAIKDAVRADLALKYLYQSQLSAREIAYVPGYEDATSLSRSFRRWHHDSIRAKRTGPRKRDG